MLQRIFKFTKIFVGLCWLGFTTSAGGAEIEQSYRSIRAQGMGGVSAAIADDYNTLFFNPAGLSRLTEGEFNGFLRFGAEPTLLKLRDDISAAGSEASAINDAVAKYYGQYVWGQPFSLGGVWVRPNWGVVFIPLDLEGTVSVQQGVGPSLDVKLMTNTTLALGYAREETWLPGKFSIGGTAKMIMRGSLDKTIPAVDLAASSEVVSRSDLALGLTADLDVSSLWTPDWKTDYGHAHFSLVGRNLLDMGFKTKESDGLGEPTRLGRRFDLGSVWEFPQWSFFSPQAAFDIRDMGHENWTARKGTHLGLELKWDAWGWLRGAYRVGINQGYWTAGVSLQAAWFALDLASWGEEMGTASANLENRRYMLQLNLNI